VKEQKPLEDRQPEGSGDRPKIGGARLSKDWRRAEEGRGIQRHADAGHGGLQS
jgi:hypothetical protein